MTGVADTVYREIQRRAVEHTGGVSAAVGKWTTFAA
jgi:hypothetical protein